MNLLLLLVLLCVVAQLKNSPLPSILKRNKQILCWVAVILLVLCMTGMNIEGIMVKNNNNEEETQDISLLCMGSADCNCKSDNDCKIDVNNLTLQSNGIITSFSRIVNQDNRNNTLIFVKNVVNRSIEILNWYRVL